MADGHLIFKTDLDNAELVKELDKTKKDIERLQKKIDTAGSKRLPLAERVKELKAQLEAARSKAAELEAEFVRLNGVRANCNPNDAASVTASENAALQMEALEKEIASANTKANKLQEKFDAAAERLETADLSAAKLQNNLDGAKTKAVELERQLAKAQSLEPLINSLYGAEKKVSKFTKRIGTMMRKVFLFSVILAALRSVKNWFWQIIKKNDEATAAIARLKGALLTLAQPIVDVAIPAFTKLCNILAKIVAVAANAAALLFGRSVQDTAKAAEALNAESEAVSGVGDAAEEAAGKLAGFDEINQLNGNSSSGASASSDSIEPNFDLFDLGEYQSKIDQLTAVLGGALLVLGAILTFSGVNIPLGIGMMALGAAILYKEAQLNWGDPGVRNAINAILLATGICLLVIGAILAFSTVNIPVGIAMMASGAVALYSAAALNWGALSTTVREAISGVLTLAGMVALVVGLCLALSGVNIPLGLGLTAIGAASLVTATALNWDVLGDTIYEKLANIGVIIGPVIAMIGLFLVLTWVNLPLGIAMIAAGATIFGVSLAVLNWDMLGDTVSGKLGVLLAIAGGFLAVLGVILTLSGAAIPLGLGLLVAGAAALMVGSVAIQWDSVPNTVQDKLGLILKVVGGFLFVIGLVMLIAGPSAPIGLALMIAGASALGVSAVTLNWDFIKEKVASIWQDVKSYWRSNIAQYFTTAYWKSKASGIISGLVSGIKAGASKIKNAITDTVSNAWNSVTSIFSSGSSGGSRSASAASVQATSARITAAEVPALAKGAVVPSNREFLAVLGDNKQETEVVSPLSTIKQALLEALQEAGGLGNGGDIHITVELDGKVVARNTVRHINDMTIRAGKPVLLI